MFHIVPFNIGTKIRTHARLFSGEALTPPGFEKSLRHLRSLSLALWLLGPLLGCRLGLRLGLGHSLSFLQVWLVVITFFISRDIFALPLALLHLLGQKLEGVLFRQNLDTPAHNNGGRPTTREHCTWRKPVETTRAAEARLSSGVLGLLDLLRQPSMAYSWVQQI